MPGASRTHSLVCEVKKHTSKVATGEPKRSDIPCAMVYGLYAISPVSMTS